MTQNPESLPHKMLISPEARIIELETENEFLRLRVAQLESTRLIDEKTGISSYAYFKDRICPEIQNYLDFAGAEKRGDAQRLVFGFGDINAMNRINEISGHTGGDYVLTQVAKALKTAVRSQDWVGRYGEAADEFCFLLRLSPGISATSVINDVEQRIHDNIRQIEHAPSFLSMSVGFVTIEACKDVGEVIELADMTMYANKKAWKTAQRAAGFMLSSRLSD